MVFSLGSKQSLLPLPDSRRVYDCYPTFNDDHNIMTCAMDTGYFLCTTGANACPMPNDGWGGWGNCTYHESKTKNHPIYTCDTFLFGRERCFKENGTCCWYSN